MSDITDFSAKEPSLGYYYQILYSLYTLIKNGNRNSKIRIECLDDIELLDSDKTNLLQTKLHLKSKANLTDASPDFWKTIRVWVDNISTGKIDLDTTTFSLITTEKISNSSVLKNFSGVRNLSLFDTEDLIQKLNKIANESTNTTNKLAYEAFLALDHDKKKKLVENISIVDSSFDVSTLIFEIKNILKFSITLDKLDLLTDRVIGLWSVSCVRHLLGEIEEVTYIETHAVIIDLADSFKEDNLPDDFSEAISISDVDLKSYVEKTFVKQLELISLKASSTIVKNAISDFRRAYEQRSRWVRESLINIADETQYNKKLIDGWNNLFAILENQCESVVEPDELAKLSKDFYLNLFVANNPQIYIKKNFNASYMVRGSYHILSDKKEIGWHIKYKDLL